MRVKHKSLNYVGEEGVMDFREPVWPSGKPLGW